MDPLTTAWLEALERRHLANLTTSEVARALRALSSCYVERRGKLSEGGALASAGKRAAFALFYGPLHFLVVRRILQSLSEARAGLSTIVDLGCGTGAAGAAWALEAGATTIRGFDRHPWAVDEANQTYRQLRLDGRAQQRDIASIGAGIGAGIGTASGQSRDALRITPQSGLIAAYAANELAAPGREALLSWLLAARERGARVLVVEPIARRSLPWWDDWAAAFEPSGGRADEWRFPAELPATQRGLAKAAGLDPRELTARSLFL
jgi:Methyltransferase domain